MSNIIHSRKSLIEILSDINLILGIISAVVFVLSFLPKPIIDGTTVSVLCLIASIISSVIIASVTIVYRKNFVGYHCRAIAGFVLVILSIVLSVILGK